MKPEATAITHWRRQMDDNIPPAPKPGEMLAMHDIISFNAIAEADGMHIRMRFSSGQILDFAMNPVVAHALAIVIGESGAKAGWLEQDGAIMGRHRPI